MSRRTPVERFAKDKKKKGEWDLNSKERRSYCSFPKENKSIYVKNILINHVLIEALATSHVILE